MRSQSDSVLIEEFQLSLDSKGAFYINTLCGIQQLHLAANKEESCCQIDSMSSIKTTPFTSWQIRFAELNAFVSNAFIIEIDRSLEATNYSCAIQYLVWNDQITRSFFVIL